MPATKPELLLPVGNVESLYAAIEGCADAIYLGLKGFNARGRAANFTEAQLAAICKLAAKHHVKVYVTLNIVVKNSELADVLDTLQFLSGQPIAGVIIQDWGVFSLMRRYFPKLVAHASTQMANHNSVGANHCQRIGFKRVVLAREITFRELELIQQRTKIETEVFVHGALCYSISGFCQFSSFLGGAGANRGLCTQPCRRFYNCQGQKRTFFSMKDNQLIDKIKELAQMGVSSLKVEGRLKSGEYVYTVAQAYRKALDCEQVTEQVDDLSRPKTQWFMGRCIAESIADNPNTGLLIGKVTDCHDGTIVFTTNIELAKGNRLRVRTDADTDQNAFVLDNFRVVDSICTAKGFRGTATAGTDIYLTAYRSQKIGNELPATPLRALRMPQALKKEIVTKTRKQLSVNAKSATIVRIDNLDWLKCPSVQKTDIVIVSLPTLEWHNLMKFNISDKRLQQKIWIELPPFVSEKKIEQVRQFCANFANKGYNRFVLSHLSQADMLPPQSRFATNELVYAYNDAAAAWLQQQGTEWFISPVENEYENLLTGACRSIVVPVYFRPRLFISRMPVKLPKNQFADEHKNRYQRHRINGLTIITPEQPVCITQYANKLRGKNFNRFLLDLSFEKPDNNHLAHLLKLLATSEGIQGTSAFNFKKGLR
ncbi:MAG: U32 family peptidase [Salinivirgaceae bacterium]|nr:U32 family peptidase [Salinivirgaceae bacterium]